MKLKEQIELVREGDNFSGVDFDVNPDDIGRMLKAFSDGIYSNKIGSMIREIASNAVDANIESGNDNHPIILSLLGTYDNRVLEIKDVGPGMTREFIQRIYTRYWASTKRESNKYIGAFGIGSKSPLSYTNRFECITCVNGTEYHYLIHKGEKVPRLECINEAPTTEPNGTRIRIPIKSYDVASVQKEAINQLAYFDNVYFEGLQISNDFKFYKESKYIIRSPSAYNDVHIVLGRVSYPIDWIALGEESVQIPVGLIFDIGELTVTINREQIEYTKVNKKKILKRLKEVIDELTVQYSSQYPVCDTLIEYMDQKAEMAGDWAISPDITINVWRLGISSKPAHTFNFNPDNSASFTCYKRHRYLKPNGTVVKTGPEKYHLRALVSAGRKIIVKSEGTRYNKLTNMYILDHMDQSWVWEDADIYQAANDTNLPEYQKNYYLRKDQELKECEPYVVHYEDIEPTTTWINNRYQELLRKSRERSALLKQNGSINVMRGYISAYTDYQFSLYFRRQSLNIKEVMNSKYHIVYGTQENKEDFISVAMILSGVYGIRTYWRFYLVSKANMKYLQNTPNASYYTDFMDGKHKLFRRLATAYWLQDQNLEQYNVDLNIRVAKVVSELIKFRDNNSWELDTALKDAIMVLAGENDLISPVAIRVVERLKITKEKYPLYFCLRSSTSEAAIREYTFLKTKKLRENGESTISAVKG